MRFSLIKLMQGLLYTAPALLLTLAACGGGGGGGGDAPATPPAAPANVVASTSLGCVPRISISWNAVTGATGYDVYRSTATGVAGTKITAAPVTISPYVDVDTALAKATTYFYTVTAANAVGNSATSTAASAMTGSTVCTLTGGSMQGVALTLAKTVATIAGKGGIAGLTNDTGTLATFNTPSGMATDGVYLYVADSTNNAIRKINIVTKVVTTLAGSGTAGFANGTGTLATFNNPLGVTTDGTNIYVVDTGNSAIRKITSGGVVTTLATGLAIPKGITFDNKDLYVTDGATVYKIVIATPTPTVFATGLNSGFGITFEGANFYVADAGSSAIVQITPAGAVSTYAGGVVGNLDGIGTAAKFTTPQGIASDGTNLYVSDTGNHTIRKIDANKLVTTLAGTGLSGKLDGAGASATFSSPTGITTDGNSVYIADFGTNIIRQMQ